MRLNHDDAQRMAATITDADERWTVDVGLRHGRFPHVDLAGWMQLTRFLTDEGAPGCLAGLLGRTGEGRATLDLAALEAAGGTLVVAEGRANRFLSSARLHVDPTAVSWRVDGDLVLRARGLGRVVLLLARRRARRNVERGLEDFWTASEEWISGVERNLREISVMVEREGGAAVFVHRALWDPEFDPRPPGGRT